jgi:hypothetical protein
MRHLPLARFRRRHEPVQCRHSVTLFSSSPSSQSEHASDYNGLEETLGCIARVLSLCLCQSFFFSVRMAARALPLTSERVKLQSKMNCRTFQKFHPQMVCGLHGSSLSSVEMQSLRAATIVWYFAMLSWTSWSFNTCRDS